MLNQYATASEAPLIEAVKRAQDYLLPEFNPGDGEKVLGLFLSRHGKFTKSEVAGGLSHAKSEEGDCRTLWQLVQGLTAYARGFDWLDARFDLEKRAGALLELASTTKN